MNSALLPLVPPAIGAIIAGIVGWVAWVQMQIAREKLRADLFDRRFAIFDAHYKMVRQVVRLGGSEPGPSAAAIEAADLGASGAVFLLDRKLAAYIDELREAAWKCLVFEEGMITGLSHDGAERGRFKAERAEQAREHLSSAGDRLIGYFEPYLRLHAMTRLPYPQTR